jgi:MFS family permease
VSALSVHRLARVLAGNVLFGAGLFCHAFLYNFYLEALGHDAGVMGLAAAALTAGGLCALVPAGRLVDRYGPARLLVGAALLASAGLAAGALVETPGPIYASAFLAGLGTVTWRVATGPVLMGVAGGSLRSRAFSWNVGLLVGSGAAWMALAGAGSARLVAIGLVPEAAHRTVLLVGAIATAAAGVLFEPLARMTPPPAAQAPARGERVRGGWLGSDTRFAARALPAVVVWMLAPALVAPFLNIYFSRVHALSVEQIGVAFGAAHAGTALVLLLSGEIAARGSPRVALALWTLTFPPAVWLLGAAYGVEWALLLYFVQGIASPAANPLIDELLLSSTPPERHGAVSSWRNATTEVAGIVGAAVGGLVLRTRPFGPLFTGAAAVGLAGAVLLLLFTRSGPDRRGGAERERPSRSRPGPA